MSLTPCSSIPSPGYPPVLDDSLYNSPPFPADYPPSDYYPFPSPVYSPPSPPSNPPPCYSPSPSPLSDTPLSSYFKQPPVTAESSSGSARGKSYGVMVGLILGAIVVAIGVGILVYRYRRNKRRGQNNKDHKGNILPLDRPISPSAHSFDPSFSKSTLTYEELSKATDNFSKANLLGQGGFGFVYKGVLSNGGVVAVKQLKTGSWQGEREFQAEIETISRIHHRHLVSLVGYCINEAQRLLVYEFLPNNSLEFHLHGKDQPTMNWTTRLKIAIGSAKGLAYLHEDCHPKIIHRDIKAANILLDNSFEAKVTDFGLAKYFPDNETHVSTRVVGTFGSFFTFGYMAPEYASSGKLAEKSDVFSFGVVLLELITGRFPVARTQSVFNVNIVNWARPLLRQALQANNHDALVDPKLQKDYDSVEMGRVITCAAACVHPYAWLRPRMSQIARALEGEMTLGDLNKGTASGNGRNYGLYETTDYNSDPIQDRPGEIQEAGTR